MLFRSCNDLYRLPSLHQCVCLCVSFCVRDILDFRPDPEHVASKAEELIEVLGVIYALSDQDIDHRVTANVDSGSRVHQHLPQSNSLLLSAVTGKF